MATVKQLFLETFREEVDPKANMDIFDVESMGEAIGNAGTTINEIPEDDSDESTTTVEV